MAKKKKKRYNGLISVKKTNMNFKRTKLLGNILIKAKKE